MGRWHIDAWRCTLAGGIAAFACFAVAMLLYPGGGYNPFLKMLSELGRTEIRKVAYPTCHHWFVAGMFLAAASVSGVWVRLARLSSGWRRMAAGWGGAANVAGLITIALVPENVNMNLHNIGCNLAAIGGAAILAARFRKCGGDLAWTVWLLALVSFFLVCLTVKAIPFSPWVTATQKILIVSFAVWTGWIAWTIRAERLLKKVI